MKLENSKLNECTDVKNPKKEDAILDERLILKMDEESPAHPFPNIKPSSSQEKE